MRALTAQRPAPHSAIDDDRSRSAARLLHPASPNATPVLVEPDVLHAIAAGLASSVDASALAGADTTSRRYVRLLATSSYEAWLIAWPPAAALELHDHGGSTGAVHVRHGELIETYTDRVLRHSLRSRAVTEGETLTIPSTRVHEVWNPGPADALSVHVYSPPLTTMTFFDHQGDHFLEPLRTERADHRPSER